MKDSTDLSMIWSGTVSVSFLFFAFSWMKQTPEKACALAGFVFTGFKEAL